MRRREPRHTRERVVSRPAVVRREPPEAESHAPPAAARYVGVLRHQGGRWLLAPFDPGISHPIHVHPGARMGGSDEDAVVVEVDPAARGARSAHARVVEVLGRMDQPGVDVRVVSRRHGLAAEFPDPVLREAGRIPARIPERELGRRERFDEPPAVTIDGETARDFDDAIAVAELPRGGYRLFVHIADVGHFVRPAGALDREARRRGTSVYFPDTVIPMFPERLSNDLCSLRPGEDRLVQSVILDLDRSGVLHGVRFADGVIRSAARLTYSQVGAVVEGGRRRAGVPESLIPMLRLADRLRGVLEARHRARGSLDFDLPEPRILLDVEGAMTGIVIEPRNHAHRMIEEFMILANEAVASHLAATGGPSLYRIHERPDPGKIEALASFAAGVGLSLAVDTEAVRPRDLQRFLESAADRPEYAILAQMTLRSLKQARYAPENAGHFGLAAPVYTHFTSPIRRYPDLVAHRLLRAARSGSLEAQERLGEGLEELSESCSRLEREAETAERELLEWKKIAYVRAREGETLEGVVTGVARFGLFVRLEESLVEGLLHVARLGDDRFEFHEGRQELRGARSGRAFRLGDRLKVVLDRVDRILRRVDLSLSSLPGPRPEPRAAQEEAGRRGRGTRGRGRNRGGARRRGRR